MLLNIVVLNVDVVMVVLGITENEKLPLVLSPLDAVTVTVTSYVPVMFGTKYTVWYSPVATWRKLNDCVTPVGSSTVPEMLLMSVGAPFKYVNTVISCVWPG